MRIGKIELTQEQLIIAVAVMVGAIVLGLYLFLYSPLINKLKLAHLESKAIETDVFQARDEIPSLRIRDTKKGLITEEGVSLAIDELTKQGKSKGVNFISMTPKKIEKGEPQYKILPIEMDIESTYEELGAFLGSLEELKKSLVTVRSFNIASINQKSVELKTKLVVNMHLLD